MMMQSVDVTRFGRHNEKPPTVIKTVSGLYLTKRMLGATQKCGCDCAHSKQSPWLRSRRLLPMRIVEIQELVCQAYDVRLVDMLSGRRGRRLIEPRWVAMWLARETTLHSLPVIGRHFGGRDHTTVMHAVAQIDARRHEDQAFAVRLGALRHAVDRANGLVSDELPAPRKLSPAAIYALASAKAYLAREIAAARAEMRGAA